MADALAGQQLAFLDFAFHVNNIHQLIGQGAELLGNPVAVFDSHYYTVAYSDTRGIKDDVWLPERSGATASSNIAAMLHGLDHIREHSAAFRIFDDFGPHRRRISPLVSNSVIIGYLTVLEYNRNLDDVPDNLYDLVISAVTKELAVEQALKQSRRADSAEFLLVNLLNNEFANRMLYEQRVLGTEFEQERLYRLLSIDMSAFQSRTTGRRISKRSCRRCSPERGRFSIISMWYSCLTVKVASRRTVGRLRLWNVSASTASVPDVVMSSVISTTSASTTVMR